MNSRLIELFWKKVNVGPYCWEWTAAVDQGYGRIVEWRKGKQINWGAHRLSWTIHKGKIPKRMCVCHKCDNPSCVNPEHLFLGTNKDNLDDMVSKGRASVGTRNGNAKLDDQTVRDIRDLKTACTYKELRKMFGLSIDTLLQVCKRRRWRHVQ